MVKNNFGYIASKLKINPARFLLTFLDNCYVFLFQKKPHRGPLAIVWDVTNKCNLGCIFCEWWKTKDNLSPTKKELTTQQRLNIIRKLSKAGTWLLSFCGGEPLLCQGLGLLIKEAKSKGMLVNVSTNGLLLEENAEMLVKSGVDFITVSIDSHNSEFLDKIRGHIGLFDKIGKGIDAVRNLSKNKYVYIEARYLINRLNCYFIEDFVKRWEDKIDFITLKPIYNNPFVLYKVPSSMRFLPEDEGKFRVYFSKFLKKYKNLNNPYIRQIPNFIFNPELLKGKFLCFAGTFFAGIDYEGNLCPCHELSVLPNRVFGNLLEEDFMSLWKSEQIKKLRVSFKQGLRCNCWRELFSLSIYLEKILTPLDKFLNIFRI